MSTKQTRFEQDIHSTIKKVLQEVTCVKDWVANIVVEYIFNKDYKKIGEMNDDVLTRERLKYIAQLYIGHKNKELIPTGFRPYSPLPGILKCDLSVLGWFTDRGITWSCTKCKLVNGRSRHKLNCYGFRELGFNNQCKECKFSYNINCIKKFNQLPGFVDCNYKIGLCPDCFVKKNCHECEYCKRFTTLERRREIDQEFVDIRKNSVLAYRPGMTDLEYHVKYHVEKKPRISTS